MNKFLRLSLLFVLIAPTMILGQDEFLKGRVDFRQLYPRTSSPLSAEVTLTWNHTSLLEGVIGFKTIDDRGDTYTVKGIQVTMLKGEQKFRMMLPPVKSSGYETRLEYQMFFEFKDGRKKVLSRPSFDVSPFNKWVLTVGVCIPDLVEDSSWTGLDGSFSLENFDPQSRNYRESPIGTYTVRFSPREISLESLYCCRFDVILIHGRAFKSLRKKQLQSIAEWVMAGGSLCIIPTDQLDDYHADFLNTLASEKSFFGVSGEGRLKIPDKGRQDTKGILKFNSELGRTVVVTDKTKFASDWKSPAWQASVLFLWKVRNDQVSRITEKGKWLPQEMSNNRYEGYRFFPSPLQSSRLIRNFLLSSHVRVVPLGLILILLVVFVCVIGPLEYFILGFFRIRKYTWFVFPTVCILFSLITIQLANHYLGSKDYYRSVRIVDVGSKGQPLRQSIFRMGFAAQKRSVIKKLKHQTVSFMNYRDFSNDDYYNWGSYTQGTGSTGRSSISGVMPSSFTLTLEYDKWSPRLTRYMSFCEVDIRKGLSGNILNLFKEASDSSLENLKSLINKKADLSGNLYLLECGGTTNVYVHNNKFGFAEVWVRNITCRTANIPDPSSRSRHRYKTGGNEGFFRVLSQISPHGGSNFTDLAYMDKSDSDMKVLIYMEEKNEELIVYRKLVTKE